MKVLCPSCERLITLEQFRLDGAALVVTCQACSAQTRVEPMAPLAAAEPVMAPAPRTSAPALPKVSLASTGASNVVVLRTAGHEAVQKAARAADEGPWTIPDGACPKCVARRRDGVEACPSCGIRYESFDEATVLPPKWLRDEWVALLRDWGNEALHAQLRRKAQQVDALAAVGRLYRLRQAAVPEDPAAAEALADIVRLASVPMGLPRREEDLVERRRKALFVGGAVFLLLALLSGLVWVLLGR
ncbi:MAG: hypothetical protein ACOZQL_37790 [Myxococcota bacterium]